MTLPALSPATQRVVGQDTPKTSFSQSTSAVFQVRAPPAGSVEVTALPALSPATHSAVDGQDRPRMSLPPSTFARVQAEGPPAGLTEVSALPELSTATHNFADGQETASRLLSLSVTLTFQAGA